jgi:hypothetical protein
MPCAERDRCPPSAGRLSWTRRPNSYHVSFMMSQVGAYIVVAVFAVCWLGAVVTWFLAAKCMLKTLEGYRPDRQWGKLLPFSLLMPCFFTEEGNRHRTALLRHMLHSSLFAGAGLGIGMALRALGPA